MQFVLWKRLVLMDQRLSSIIFNRVKSWLLDRCYLGTLSFLIKGENINFYSHKLLLQEHMRPVHVKSVDFGQKMLPNFTLFTAAVEIPIGRPCYTH